MYIGWKYRINGIKNLCWEIVLYVQTKNIFSYVPRKRKQLVNFLQNMCILYHLMECHCAFTQLRGMIFHFSIVQLQCVFFNNLISLYVFHFFEKYYHIMCFHYCRLQPEAPGTCCTVPIDFIATRPETAAWGTRNLLYCSYRLYSN